MECRGYGPCLVPGVQAHAQAVDMLFDADKCAAITPAEVLTRVCTGMSIDERHYLDARRAFEAMLASPAADVEVGGGRADGVGPAGGGAAGGGAAGGRSVTAERLRLLREAAAALTVRADEQARQSPRELEAASGVQLLASYEVSSGGGVPWRANERVGYYNAHERARYSCAGCSGDVVPEKDLMGCWPLWTQFAPDELRYVCNRSWTSDPGLHEPRRFLSATEAAPMPCWQTCWTPTPRARAVGDVSTAHCTAACPATTTSAVAWRQRWDRELASFVGTTLEGRRWQESMRFAGPPKKMADFVYNVY